MCFAQTDSNAYARLRPTPRRTPLAERLPPPLRASIGGGMPCDEFARREVGKMPSSGDPATSLRNSSFASARATR